MAVDFSTKATDVDTQIEPGSLILEPPSRQGEINALDRIGRGVEVGAKTVATIFRNREAQNANKYLANFSISLNSLQDAADQGLSSSEMRVRSRALLSEALANNPNAEADILQRYSTWLNQSGVDKISAPSVQRAQIQQAQVEAAVSNGFLTADQVGNPAATEKAITELEAFQASVRQLEMDTKEVNNATSRLGLTEKQKAVAKAEGEDKIITSLAKVGQTALPYWRTQYETIKAAAAGASSEQERQEIIKNGIASLQTDFAQRTAAMSGDGLATNQAKIDQILMPQRNLIDAYIKELSGEYDTESFKRVSDSAKAQADMMVWQGLTPTQRQWVAMSNLSKAAGDVLAGQFASVAVDMFSKNQLAGDTAIANPGGRSKPADVLPSGDEEISGVKNYLDNVATLVKRANSGVFDDATKAEVQTQMLGILKGVDVHANSVESAKEFQPVIDFFANPDVGQYLASEGGIPPQITAKVQRVFQDGYASQVVPLLKRDYSEALRTTVRVRAGGNDQLLSVDKLADPVMEAGRFGFRIKAEFADDFAAKGAVRTLNSGPFVKVLNKMVISNAHIQGNMDYQKSFEQLSPQIFKDNEMIQEDSKVDLEDRPVNDPDLELADLDLGQLEEGVATPAAFVPAADNPDVDAAVMARFAGRRVPVSIRNNNMGAVSITGPVKSSWAAKQPGFVGVTKRPAAEGGYYAVYATPEDGVAAASKLLENYGNSGVDTPTKIVKKWSEDTKAHNAYAKKLVVYLTKGGFKVDEDTQLDLSDPAVRLAILKAKSDHEAGAGRPVYAESVFISGVSGGSNMLASAQE